MDDFPAKPDDQPIERLTQREQEILALLAGDQSNQEIADQLYLALSSTKWFIGQIYQKLGVDNRRSAVKRALELGLLEKGSLPLGNAQPSVTALPPGMLLPTGTALPVGTVTFLFTDIEGSTPLWESQPQRMVEALQIHNTVLRLAIETNAGVVFKTIGDAFQASFATAPQALQAAIDGQRSLQSAPWNELGPLKVRMGLHTGEAALDPDGDEYAVSHTKNRVARIMSAAQGGQILISHETADLVDHQLPSGVNLKDLGKNQLKGLAIPEHLFQVCASGLPRDFPPLATTLTHSHNLPVQLTSFVGRQAEIDAIKSMVQEHPLVTLTGSGGVGKTRISIQVAREMLETFPDGAWLVELAPVSDPDQVPNAVANAFNLREDPGRPILETLVDFLRRKQALILLDNCEHLLFACVDLTDRLLSDCPQLKLLASSREALGIAGETAYRVPSLSYPDPHQLPSLDQFKEYPAVRLFIERANAVMPGFQVTCHPVTGKNASTIAQICRRLDGIPLAIELAAARLNLLTTEQLASRLDNAFRLLTGGSRSALPRQQTLRATIDWSYDMLSDQERTLLRRLSVFAGSCSLEAAEAVCTGNGIILDEILDLISSLTNKSIIQAERKQGDETRYRLLETVRQYAREKLFDARESATMRDRHLEYYLELAEGAEPQLRSQGRLEWSRRLRIEMDNLRSALDWAYQQENSAQKGLQLVTAIGFRFLTPNGYLLDTIHWVLQGLDLVDAQTVEPVLLARSYNLLAEVFENQRNYPAVLEYVQKSLPILRESGAPAFPDLAWALWDYALALAALHKDNQQAIEILDESIRISRKMGVNGAWYLGMSLYVRSFFAFAELNHIYQINQECRKAFTSSGDRWSVMLPLEQLGSVSEDENNLQEALQSYQEAAILAEEIGDRPNLSYLHIHLGRIQRKQGNYLLAIQHHIEYVKLWATMGNQEALKEGFVHLGVDWYMMGRFSHGTAQQEAYRHAICTLAIAEKQRSLPYSLMWEPELINEAVSACQAAWGETEYARVWEQGQGMSIEEAILFAQAQPG